MKKAVVLIGILLLAVGFVFAVNLTSDTMKVTLNLDPNGEGGDTPFTPVYKVGFTNDADPVVSATATPSDADTLELKDSTNDAALRATGTTHVYYQILSNTPVYITLGGEALTEDGGAFIDWTGTLEVKKSGDSEPSSSATLSKGDSYAAKTIYTHTPGVATGSYGALEVAIETGDASNAAAKDYSATLTVTVVEGTPTTGAGA